MRTWRIGSNWGGIDVFPIFKKHKIAFAGSEVELKIQKVTPGNLIAITRGQSIIAIGKTSGVDYLRNIDPDYIKNFADVSCIKFSSLYAADDHVEIDFGLYEGQGKQFHEAHNEYQKRIKKLFYQLNSQVMLDNLKELLEYKKQIILQGPPGTGKTYTAKQLAEVLTKERVVGNPISLINQYFSERTKATSEKIATRQGLKELLNNFQAEFPKENLHALPLEKYLIGKGDNTFCWWIEYGLTDLGGYSGQASKFKLYWKKDISDYSKSGFIKDVADDDKAMKMIAEQLQKIANEQDLLEAEKKLSTGFVLKILHSYYPDKYFPINNEKYLDNALKLLNIDYSGRNAFQKSSLLQDTFLEKRAELGADVTNFEFMGFLFGKLNLRGPISFNNKELVANGEYNIIQFHPAYTYEDFVRGISTVANETHIEYKVENRILAEFAEKALRSPSSNFVLVIDEINRANLPAVLGELIYALEYRYDKEDPQKTSVESIYSLLPGPESESNEGRVIRLPKNLYIIGTMNTADRSVGHIDYAIRRRFAFKNVLPNKNVVHKLSKSLFKEVSVLFIEGYEDINWDEPILRKSKFIAQDFNPEDVWIGHSYFMSQYKENKDTDKARKELQLKLEYEIKPLLREYVKDGILREDIQLGGAKSALEYINNLSL